MIYVHTTGNPPVTRLRPTQCLIKMRICKKNEGSYFLTTLASFVIFNFRPKMQKKKRLAKYLFAFFLYSDVTDVQIYKSDFYGFDDSVKSGF